MGVALKMTLGIRSYQQNNYLFLSGVSGNKATTMFKHKTCIWLPIIWTVPESEST